MKIRHYGPLIQLTRLGAFSSYLVLEDDSLTLVDTNFAGSARGILQAVAQFPLPIRRIILTHAHNDHVGSLDALCTHLRDVEIIISEREAPLLAGDLRLLPGEPVAKLRGGYMTPHTAPTRLVKEGDRVGSLEVVALPGHTPGQIGLLDTRNGSFIAADAFTTTVRVAVAGTLVRRFPFSALSTWHAPTALASAKKVQALNPSLLAVGHGPVIVNPVSAIEEAIRVADARVARSDHAVSRAG